MNPRIESSKSLSILLIPTASSLLALSLWLATYRDSPPLAVQAAFFLMFATAWVTTALGRSGRITPAGVLDVLAARYGQTGTAVDERQRAVMDAAHASSWSVYLKPHLERGQLRPDGARAAFSQLLREIAYEDRARIERELLAALAERDGFDLDYRLAATGTKAPWQRNVGRIFRDASGQPEWLVGLAFDQTRCKQIEAELKSAKLEAEAASQAKTEFLAYMSHEIRTPLAAILGFCEILEDPDQSGEDHAESVRIIKRNGELLSQIVNNVLDLTKIEAGRLEVECIRFIVRDIVSDVCLSLAPRARAKGVELVCQFQESMPQHALTDPTRLKQILINIVGNAIKFTERGTVRINVRSIPPDVAAGDPWRLEFVVKDSGIGFTEEQRSRLFKAFCQADRDTSRKYGGSGLGLTLARKLARTLGGDVELVESRAGAGSTFRVRVAAGTR